ncbi:nucleocapsid protein [Cabbage cytorhabdovirus 1]|uniref:Nucleoprotein n=1 Tax=Cabbage cytorhabdovirus 1 TaxID=2051550 RepID=A0A2D2PYK6_9RHAB|nr:nucleocapsid protein [Cabbage cytorhabdovirus 1]ATS17308.1 nucleocapsid protein [Cabbage cytorhabdovirus 1]
MTSQKTEQQLQDEIQRIRMERARKGKNIEAGPSNVPPPVKPRTVLPKQTSNQRYLEIDSVSVGKLTSVPWSDTELSKIPIYRVNAINAAKCLTLGRTVFENLNAGTVTAALADMCLALAVSLPKPALATFEHLLTPIPATIGTGVAFNQPEVNDAAPSLTATQQMALNRARERLQTETDAERQADLQRTIDRLEQQVNGERVNAPANHVNESDATAYCFLAAFIMKLNGKAEDAFQEGIAKMKIRYPAWYEGGSQVLLNFNPTLETLKALRTIFNRRPEILSTWVMTVAVNENREGVMLPTHQGLLNYLVCQQYSYFGMHAYSLLLSIHEATGIKLGQLLREMDCPITRAGVMAAFDLIKNHEITSKNPARTTYFRYARVWNSNYFRALQSSNCTTLVYVAAKVAKITSAQKVGGDPMEIYALKNIDEVMLTRLNKVAAKMSELILTAMMEDEIAGVAWQ